MKLLNWLFGSRKPALNKPVVSGKRPTIEDFFRQSYPISEKWDKFDYTAHQFNADDMMDFAERYACQAACASGAVDTVAEAEEVCHCGNPSGLGNCHFEGDEELIYMCADCGKRAEFPNEEQP